MCKCRFCSKIYEEYKSRADWKGYCSQKCLHAMAKKYGYKKPKAHETEIFSVRGKIKIPSEYQILKNAGLIGSVELKRCEQ